MGNANLLDYHPRNMRRKISGNAAILAIVVVRSCHSQSIFIWER